MTDALHPISPAPVRKSLLVAASPEVAFGVFAERMGRWWPRSHSVNASPLTDVVIEPFVGGRWFERGADGSIALWGDVLVWSPPRRLVLAWRLDADWVYRPDLETEVEVTFTAQAEGTRVEFEHRRLEAFGAAADKTRGALDSDRGWSGILALFAADCAG